MATTYVKFTREEFEAWLDDTQLKWEQKRGTAGVYLVILSNDVGVEVSSSLTGRDDVVDRANASMSVKLVSRVTGQTLNKKAQGQDHFKRTINWRENLKKGLDRMVSTYRASSSFYDVIARIPDREKYKLENIAKIERNPNWKTDEFLSSLHARLLQNGVLTEKQQAALDRSYREPEPPPKVDAELLGKVRALYAVARARNNARVMDFAKTVGEMMKAGQPSTPQLKAQLHALLHEHASAISNVLRQSPQLSHVASTYVREFREESNPMSPTRLATNAITRYFFFTREGAPPENEWLVEAVFDFQGRPTRSYLMPLDPDDGWGSMGRHALATEWQTLPENQVPPKVRQKVRERMGEHWSLSPVS